MVAPFAQFPKVPAEGDTKGWEVFMRQMKVIMQKFQNLDNLDDGTTHARTKATALTSGEVDLSKSGVINKNLDNVSDASVADRKAVTSNQKSGAGYAYSGLNSSGQLTTGTTVKTVSDIDTCVGTDIYMPGVFAPDDYTHSDFPTGNTGSAGWDTTAHRDDLISKVNTISASLESLNGSVYAYMQKINDIVTLLGNHKWINQTTP